MMLSLRFAGRELRSGVKGFRIFLACLALGVAAIAAAGSTAQAFRQGLASQAREILGGDVAVSVQLRRFTPEERAVFERLGRVSWAVANRAMAQSASGERRLVELRGVAGAYPLAGKVTVQGAPSLAAAITPEGGAWGAAVEQGLLDRLHLKLGDRFLAGNVPMVARAVSPNGRPGVRNPPCSSAPTRVSTRGPSAKPRESRSGSSVSTARATIGTLPARNRSPSFRCSRSSSPCSTAAPQAPPSGVMAAASDGAPCTVTLPASG